MSRTNWMVACFALVTLGLVGCSSDDVKEILGVDVAGEASEAAIEAAATDVIDPLATALDLISDLVFSTPPSPAFTGGVEPLCPDTNGWCDSGTATCTEGESGPEFTFASCLVSEGLESATISGGVNVIPPSAMTLVDLIVDGGLALNGTLNKSGCDTVWNINSADGTVVSGTIVQCESDEFPQSSSLLVITAQVPAIGTIQMTFTFNGTATAFASVTLDGDAYATCDVNVMTYDASCTGV